MALVTHDLSCVLAILVAPAFAPSTILTHCDTALASVIFLRAGRYGAQRLPIQTFGPAGFVQTCAAAHTSGRMLIRPPAPAVQSFSFKVRTVWLSTYPETTSTQRR